MTYRLRKGLACLALGFMMLGISACGTLGGSLPDTGPQATPTSVPVTGSPAAGAPGAGDALTHTAWELVSIGDPGAGTPVIAGRAPTLTFEAGGQAGGRGGCNSYGAQYQLENQKISIRQVTSTMMACTDDGVMDQEQRFYAALQVADSFELAGDQLKLWFDNGSGVLTFVRSQAGAPAGSELAGTQWALESFSESGAAESVLPGEPLTLAFEADGQAGGSGGCNGFQTTFQAQGEQLSFGPVTSTKRACADEAATRQEQRYFNALQSTGAFELSTGRLEIHYNEGRGMLTFTRLPAGSPATATPAAAP